MWPKQMRLAGVVGLTILLAGCGERRLEVFPVAGKILVNGVAPTNAEVTLHPVTVSADRAAKPVYPNGKVAADGTFKIGTYFPEDGAPPGEYKIMVTWPTVKVEGGEEIFGPDRLGNRFATPANPAGTYTVVAGPNEIPAIELR